MNPPRDVASTLRKVSELRALCLRLPHLPVAEERRHLGRFAQLARHPESATASDVDAIAAGWRQWWREHRLEALSDMVRATPPALIESDRRLATFALAVTSTG